LAGLAAADESPASATALLAFGVIVSTYKDAPQKWVNEAERLRHELIALVVSLSLESLAHCSSDILRGS
jgi:hypothetical protein